MVTPNTGHNRAIGTVRKPSPAKRLLHIPRSEQKVRFTTGRNKVAHITSSKMVIASHSSTDALKYHQNFNFLETTCDQPSF